MNRIKKTGESIQKKLNDSMPVSQQDSMPVSQQNVNPTQKIFTANPGTLVKIENKKINVIYKNKKMTFYIPVESEAKLNEVYTKALMRNQKIDKSALISKAIELLWKEDKNYEF